MYLQAKGRSHHQVPGPLDIGGVEIARVQVGGEENSPWQSLPQGLQHQELIIKIIPQDTNGFDGTFFLPIQLFIKATDIFRQSPQIIILAFPYGFLQFFQVTVVLAAGTIFLLSLSLPSCSPGSLPSIPRR